MLSDRSSLGFLWLFFSIAFGWAWAFWVPVALSSNGYIVIPEGIVWLLADGNPAAWGPLIAAVVVAFTRNGRSGLRRLVTSMVQVRFSFIWYAVALLLLPAIVGCAQLIASIAGDNVPQSQAFSAPVSIPIAFVWIFFLGGPLQEEAGWRGTATSALQYRMGALWASLTTGVVWGIWHLPLFYIPREEIYYNQPIWGLIVSTIILSVFLTWVYNNTGRSLFAVMLMHTSWNWANFLFTGLQTDTGGLAFLFILAGVAAFVVARFGPKNLTRARS